jgi:hypothetical protein
MEDFGDFYEYGTYELEDDLFTGRRAGTRIEALQRIGDRKGPSERSGGPKSFLGPPTGQEKAILRLCQSFPCGSVCLFWYRQLERPSNRPMAVTAVLVLAL